MLARIESFFHRLRRGLSRSERTIRRLGLSVSEGTGEEPGLLLIQIDGLGQDQFERAIAGGKMPFLARLARLGGHEVRTFYSGLPSTTAAIQGELYYGMRTGVPAFSYRDPRTGEIVSLFDPSQAQAFEKEFQQQGGPPLLLGGSSWSNVYSGGAAEEESHFCISRIRLRDLVKTGRLGARPLFNLAQLPSLLRMAGLMALELALALWDALGGILRLGQPFHELTMVASRLWIGVAMRELLRVGGKIDLARGLPIVCLNFVGFDEMAHRRGPRSRFAHWSLPGIDAVIAELYRAACRSRRRDYVVWIFSDHGQEQVRSTEVEFSGGIQAIVEECLEGSDSKRARFSIAAQGPVGHLYFEEAMTAAEKGAVAGRLAAGGKVPVVLQKLSDGRILWRDAQGELALDEAAAARLAAYPEPLRVEITRDLADLCRHKLAGDLILLGYGGSGDSWSFAAELGAHGGIAPCEIRGFLLTPPATALPNKSLLRPADLRNGVLHLLGRHPLNLAGRPVEAPARLLRVMSYNVHACLGTDGRISPRRIARVIAQANPDIVALQELDAGKPRSRGEDQADLIAKLAGYHQVFCPSVVAGAEHYGHAVLSRAPMDIVKAAPLPSRRNVFWNETRTALWSRIDFGDAKINVVTTHLGLGSRERKEQMAALLGQDWLGALLSEEPVILCGDFNCLPGSPPHRMATARMRDVTSGLRTFSSARPLVRIDHIFATRHFTCEKAWVIRSDLTRVSSDHLPLVVELSLRIDRDGE